MVSYRTAVCSSLERFQHVFTAQINNSNNKVSDRVDLERGCSLFCGRRISQKSGIEEPLISRGTDTVSGNWELCI